MSGSLRLAQVARSVHSWMGAVLSVVLIVVASTGTVLIWKDAYVGFVFPQAATPFDRSVQSATRIAEAAEEAFGAANIRSVEFGDSQFGLSTVYLLDGRAGYLAPNGDVLDIWGPNGRPEGWLIDLHHRLLAGRTGLLVVGGTGVATLILILAGFIAFWPARRLWPRGLVLRSLARPYLLLNHRNLGVVLTLPIALVVFTGIVVTFPQTFRTAFLWTQADSDIYGETFGDGVDEISGSTEARWPSVIARAQAVFPDAMITGLRWPAGEDQKVVVFRDPGDWSASGHSSVYITDRDGYMDLRIDAQTLPLGERLYNVMAPLHEAKLASRVYPALETFVSLGLIHLGVIGLVSFVGSRLPRNRRRR